MAPHEDEDDSDDDARSERDAAVVVPDPTWQRAQRSEGKSKPWWKTVPERPPAAPAAAPAASAPAPLADLADGETRQVQGSGAQPYVMKNTGGVYSCSCPAWRNQSVAIERRSCKHLRGLRGAAAEDHRVGGVAGARPAPATTARATTSAGAAADTTAPPVLLAHTWGHDIDLTGWWMSEKLDGVRAYWDGKVFISRLGNAYKAPDWFTANLPDTPLDGELWGGRKRFQRTVSVVRRHDRSDDWKEITFVVFDAPRMAGTFEERTAFVKAELETRRPPHARAHEHALCTGLDHLKEELARVEALGGEGLMMRRPGSHYEVGRSSTLLKVKSFHDAEGRVVGHQPGAGRHKGRLGALLCEMPDGTRFSVGTGFSDAERKSPPPIGSIVTYRYQELSEGGVPRFPSYVGVRLDLAWPTPSAGSTIPSPSVAQAETTTDAARRFIKAEGGQWVAWEIELSGRSHTVRLWQGDALVETRTSQLAGAAAAWRDAERLIGERKSAGFVEVVKHPS
jgi:DNA ligase-1